MSKWFSPELAEFFELLLFIYLFCRFQHQLFNRLWKEIEDLLNRSRRSQKNSANFVDRSPNKTANFINRLQNISQICSICHKIKFHQSAGEKKREFNQSVAERKKTLTNFISRSGKKLANFVNWAQKKSGISSIDRRKKREFRQLVAKKILSVVKQLRNKTANFIKRP